MLQPGLFVTRGTHARVYMIHHLSVKDGIVKLMNRNKRYVSLFNSTASSPFTAVLCAASNLGKTSVKFWHAASLPRRERGVNLRISRGKTSVNE